MEYIFDEEVFKESFNAKSDEEKTRDSIRITHRAGNRFRLFPYKASGKTQVPIVTELEEVVSGFFREALKKETEPIVFEELCDLLIDDIEIDEEDVEFFKDMLQAKFFDGKNFVADNLGLYPYQTAINNKSAEGISHFLFSVLEIDDVDFSEIKEAIGTYQFNVLENMVMEKIEEKKVIERAQRKSYFIMKTDIQQRFKKDFHFMLKSGMTSLGEFANLFSIYYFFYISQTCIILDQYCTGKRDGEVELYYALDWEKISKNRLCCNKGWDKVQTNISHMFSHAITLEILNQTKSDEMIDYIVLGELASQSEEVDRLVAAQVKRAEETYCSYIGDYKEFEKIIYETGTSETERAIGHLFKCVEAQFMNTERKRASQFYNEKYSDFCKSRWVKNRKKSGLVLNLTERDIIFLTKICLRNKSEIRLNDLYIEYEKRGFYLDGTSKEYLQEYFAKLNLIDKKSDSGDAQYVKRIL